MWNQFATLVREWRSVLITAPTVAGLITALRLTGLLQWGEWAALDQFFRLRPLEATDPRIVIVEITESDIRKIGQWPAPDAMIADLIGKLKQHQPRAIGLDIYRDLRVEPGHKKLVKVFQTTPNLIGVKHLGENSSGLAVDPPPVLSQLGQVAANDIILDADGKVRRGLLFLETKNGEAVETLGLRLALIYLQAEGIIAQPSATHPDYLQLGQAVFVRWRSNDGGYLRTYDQGYQILMNFRGPRNTFPTLSMTDILSNPKMADRVRDRIVLIGSTAASLPDFFTTPYDSDLIAAPHRTPGVEIHANLASQIISAAKGERPLIQVWSDEWEYLCIFAWSAIGAILTWLGRYISNQSAFFSAYWTTIISLISGLIIIGSSYFAFLAGWWIPVVPAILALLGSAISITGYIAHIERQERQILMELFECRVTAKLAAILWRDRHKLLENGEIQGQEMTATVLFTDLKGFSTIAENMTPKNLMVWLNEYMKTMAQIVLDHDGVIDKFIGDAVMAVFGVPIPDQTSEEIASDTQKAVACALAMATALRSLNQQWETQGKPTVAMRVGIATGTVVAGSLGSTRRQEYTVIGDTVNLASRLESYDKSFAPEECRILISEETCRYCQEKFSHKLVGNVLLKGRVQPVNVYQVKSSS